ncbi:MAG: ParB N-terminal domain-containing protein [Deltaproteobacteria bacterium]|nr:ParB N-terminal domain-containing protein [Deltaproteobacteria bacterium]
MNNIINKLAVVDIGEFDEVPGPFCMSYGFKLNTVVSSIKAVGLINRPCVRRNREGHMEIITGYRRVLALKTLDMTTVPCIDLTDSGLTDADMFLLNLNDNLCTRRFNNVEKGMILNGLLKYSPDEETDYIPLLDITSKWEADILSGIKDLHNNAKDSIAQGSVSIKTLGSLLDMKGIPVNLILNWIIKLKLNTNQQMLFIEYINDISIREGKGVNEFLNEETFVNILTDEDKNIPQKAKRFMDLLRARRLPFLTKNEKAFASLISGLDLPKGVRITPPPFFEGPDYLLEISFRDGVMLKEKIDALARIKGLPGIKAPWEEEGL